MNIGLQLRRLRAWVQTQNSPTIEHVTLAKALLNEGFTPGEAIIMHAICGAESGYRIFAWNVDKDHGKEDWGLFQINEIHRPDRDRIYDVAYNISLAYTIWKTQGYEAWYAFRNRKQTPAKAESWEIFLEQATVAVLAGMRELGISASEETLSPES